MTVYELLRQTADNLAILKRFGWHENNGLYDCCKDAEEYIRDKMCFYCTDELNKEIDMIGEQKDESQVCYTCKD